MLTRLLPPHLSLRLTTTTFPPLSLLKPPHFSTTSATYGPSLHKGLHPTPTPPVSTNQIQLYNEKQLFDKNELLDENELFDENIFTRIYDIGALRVPAEHCAALERRLRGHLLNWPRVRNIGRVPGDEVDEELYNVIDKLKEENGLVALNRRIYGKAEGDGEVLSGVLYRDKLVKDFNSKGYLNFRNLAKLSRPKRRKKGEGVRENGERGRGRGVGKNEMVLLEVVEEEGGGEEDLSGLLGEEFKGRKWKEATRLLLLDERYADKAMDEMPEAIKVSSARLYCRLTRLYLLEK